MDASLRPDGRRAGTRPTAGLERGDEDELAGVAEDGEQLVDVGVGSLGPLAPRATTTRMGKRVGVAQAAEQGDRLGELWRTAAGALASKPSAARLGSAKIEVESPSARGGR